MTRFIVNDNDIIHNYELIARGTSALVIPTLKADCYGLGAEHVFELLMHSCGVSCFAVSRLEEALALAGRGADILLLSCYHDMPSIRAAVEAGLILAVDSKGQARRIADCAKELGAAARVHIKVDTGFGRFGFLPQQVEDIAAVYRTEGLKVRGIFSHLYAAFDLKSDSADRQLEAFSALTAALAERGIDVGVRHIANSSAAIRDKKFHLDAVRIGSALTGRVPVPTSLDLKRVGRFETEIIDVRTLEKGSNVGYGGVFRLKRRTRVAVIPVGTADGVQMKKDYDTYRFFDILRYGFGVFKMLFKDNRPAATVNGKTVRAVGRVALTHTMLDVTDVECKSGDTAVLPLSPLHVPASVPREYENV